MVWSGLRRAAAVLGAVPLAGRSRWRWRSSCRRWWRRLLGYFVFRSRVQGVYFSIITQALALHRGDPARRAAAVHRRHQRHHQPADDLRLRAARTSTQMRALPRDRRRASACVYLLLPLADPLALRPAAGRAARRREPRALLRLRSGRRSRSLVFALSAALAGLAGALFVPQVGIISPATLGIVPSIEMVIWVAVGGRGTLIGAVLGALVVNCGQERLQRIVPRDLAVSSSARCSSASVLLFPSGIVGASACRAWRARPPAVDQDARGTRGSSRRPWRAPTCSPALGGRELRMQPTGHRILDVSGRHRQLRRLHRARRPRLRHRLRRAALPDRPERRRQDDAAGRHHRQDAAASAAASSSTGASTSGAWPEHQLVRRGIGRKFQTPAIFPSLTVVENLEVAVGFRGGAAAACCAGCRPARRDQSTATLERDRPRRTGARTRAGALAHGEKQWLEIGMLLVQEPKLLLLDEPVAGMTRRERDRTGELLRADRQRAHGAGRRARHGVRAPVRHAPSRVLHMGKVLCEGPMEQVQNDPRVIEVYLGPSRDRAA